jgi:hypothetical protein
MRSKLLLFAVMSFLVTACGLQTIPTSSGNYCKDEVFAYLDDRFGEGFPILHMEEYGEKHTWGYWITTSRCEEGILVFEFGVRSYECKLAHYGDASQTHYLERVYGVGKDCSELIPTE